MVMSSSNSVVMRSSNSVVISSSCLKVLVRVPNLVLRREMLQVERSVSTGVNLVERFLSVFLSCVQEP